MPAVRSGKVHGLASTGLKRLSAAPDLPTIAESGVPGFEVTAWFGLLAPKNTPRDVVARLNSGMIKVLNLPDTRERLAREGFDTVGSSPNEFAAYLQTEAKKWAKAVEISGAKAN